MGLIYLFIKLYPFFGVSLGVLSFDLARNFKRKGNRAWIGMVVLTVLFASSSVLWAVFRGDMHADQWYNQLLTGFH